jgi:hypothetical protein
MIAANKRLLKESLTEGVLTLQSHLIELYSNNLNVLATQFAIISSITLSVIVQSGYPEPIPENYDVFAYSYIIFMGFAFIGCTIVLVQCALVTMMGPAKALKGDDADIVKESADLMRAQLQEICMIATSVIFSLWVSAVCWGWCMFPIPLAATMTIIYLIGLYAVIKYAKIGFKMFSLNDNDVTVSLTEMSKRSNHKFSRLKNTNNKDTTSSNDGGSVTFSNITNAHDDATVVAGQYSDNATIIRSATSLSSGIVDAKNLKMKGYIWRRRPIEEGGVFKRVFMVLDKGLVDLYKNENHYVSHKAPLNENPFKIWTYVLELDLRKFERHVTSIRAALRRQVLGNAEFEMMDNLSSKHTFDKNYALKYHRFALVPKVATELTTQETLELLTETEQEYKTWTSTLYQVLLVFDMEGNPTVENTLRTGTKDLETAVRAANYTE